MNRKIFIGLLTAFVMCTHTISSKAEVKVMVPGQGMESHLFHSAVDTKGHFTIDSTPILPHLAMSFGFLLDFGFNNWFAVEQNDSENKDVYKKTILDKQIFAVLMFNLGLADMIVLGIQIPLVIPSGSAFSGTATDNTGISETVIDGWSSKGSIGNIAFHAKLRWLRADRHAIGIGTVLQVQLPVGPPELLTGEPGGAGTAKLIIDTEPTSWYRIALNVGIRYPFKAEKNNYLNDKFAQDSIDGSTVTEGLEDRLLFKYGPTVSFGIGQSFSFWPGVMDFVLEVYGNQLLSSGKGYLSTEASAGIKMFMERNSYLLAGYAHGLPFAGTRTKYGFQSMEHRIFLGFAFEPSIGDRDGDGIKDDVDQCPDDPEDMDDFSDADGCPEPDNDRDGILDVDDDCPLVPEDRDGDSDEDGCPERGVGDRDGDGILDEVDQCPDDPEDLDQFEDENGCPDADNDQDAILDINDMCPNEPEDIDGFEDSNGCPDPDNDVDRIPDVDDACPNEPETYNGKDDEDGCPDQGDVILTATDIKIMKKVYFKYDSAEIKKVSYDILDAVAATINNNPQIDLIEVQGHADERGNDDYNLSLTSDRAASVVKYLTNKGVNPGKLRSMGYGEFCPVEDGHHEAAWELNRRVEFKVIIIDGNPTGVDPSCSRARASGIGVQ